MNKYKVIGVMSGTSLDGVDIAFCEFEESGKGWQYKIDFAETILYDEYWKKILGNLENSLAIDFVSVHKQYGHYLGKLIAGFIQKNNLLPDFIASHGHTIFHQPGKKITCQIGDGAAIAAECGIQVICDFRSLDVALGGQGAPLVPIGDKFLFPEYDFCLNLGGFANVSFDKNGNRLAFDICPVNIILNRIALGAGKQYDHNGEIASAGIICQGLLDELNSLKYYSEKFPKSLGKEWVMKHFNPIIDKWHISSEDKLCTICEHIALQIASAINPSDNSKILITGGGAYNLFLIRH